MYMSDWIKQLDTFLKMTNKNILQHSGKISHQKALEKAHSEYDIYKEKTKNRITQVENDFLKQLDNTTKALKKWNSPLPNKIPHLKIAPATAQLPLCGNEVKN